MTLNDTPKLLTKENVNNVIYLLGLVLLEMVLCIFVAWLKGTVFFKTYLVQLKKNDMCTSTSTYKHMCMYTFL